MNLLQMFNEFVANAFRDNIGIVNFDLEVMEAVRGQKHDHFFKNLNSNKSLFKGQKTPTMLNVCKFSTVGNLIFM